MQNPNHTSTARGLSSINGRAVLLTFVLLCYMSLIVWICNISECDFLDTACLAAAIFAGFVITGIIATIPSAGCIPTK